MTQESRLVITIDARNAKKQAEDLSKELQNITNKGSVAERKINDMSQSLRSLAGYMAGVVSVGGAIKLTDQYTQMAARIRNATSSAKEYEEVQRRILETANGTYRSLSEAQEVYLSLAGGMKSLGKSTSQTLDVADSLSYAFTANAARADQAQSAMDALNKSMAKGKIDADAWISIVSAADNVIADMAKVTGKTETEIRQLGATGKIALSDLLKTLELTRDTNKELADAMENSVADGMQYLTNQIQVYLGKANEAHSITGQLASSMKLLGDNLEVVFEGGAVLAIGYMTTLLAKQAIAVKSSIAASIAKKAATEAEAEANTRLLGIEAQRQRQLVAQSITEVNIARQQRNGAITQNERAAATMRLTQAEVALAIAEKQSAVATSAYTASARGATVATTALSRAKMAASAIVGGPVGLGVTVATVAASYLLLGSSAKESTKSLRENNETAEEALKTYRELGKLEREKQLVVEKEELKKLNDELKDAEYSLKRFSITVQSGNQPLNESKQELERLYVAYMQGKISLEQYVQQVKSSAKINDDAKDKVIKLAGSIETAGKKAQEQKNNIKDYGDNVDYVAKKSAEATAKVNGVTEALEKLSNQYKKDTRKNEFVAGTMSTYNLSREHAQAIYDAREAAGILGTTKQLSQETLHEIARLFESERKVTEQVDQQNKARKEATSELEKQQKVMQVNAKVQANAAKANFAGLEKQYGLPQGLLSAIHMQESRGNTNAVGPQTKYGTAKGGFQFIDATAKRFNVQVFDLASSAEGAAKYFQKLIKMFGGDIDKAIMSYNAGEGNVQNGKAYGFKETRDYLEKVKAYMAGTAGFAVGELSAKDFEKVVQDTLKIAEQQAQARKQLELEVASEIQKIRSNLADKIESIEGADFDAAETERLKKEFTARAEAEIEAVRYANAMKLDDTSDYLKTEEQLLKKSFEQRKFAVKQDLELDAATKKEMIANLDAQYERQLAWMTLEKQQRIFNAKQQFMSITDEMNERYRLEEINISKINDAEERAFQLSMLRLRKREEESARLRDAQNSWGGVQSEMRGTSAYDDIMNTQNSRTGIAQSLFDAELAVIDQKEQDPNADMAQLALEREALWQQHQDRITEIEENANLARRDLNLAYGSEILGGMTSIFKDLAGEQSEAYRAMFAIEKGYAVGVAALKMQESIAQAMATPFPTNLVYVAQAVQQGAQIASTIASIQAGFQTGGYTGNGGVSDIAGFVHGKEYVLNAAATKRVGVGTLNAINSGADLSNSGISTHPVVNIVVNTPNGYTATQNVGKDGTITIDVVDAWNQQLLGNANSKTRKAMAQNTTAGARRG